MIRQPKKDPDHGSLPRRLSRDIASGKQTEIQNHLATIPSCHTCSTHCDHSPPCFSSQMHAQPPPRKPQIRTLFSSTIHMRHCKFLSAVSLPHRTDHNIHILCHVQPHRQTDGQTDGQTPKPSQSAKASTHIRPSVHPTTPKAREHNPNHPHPHSLTPRAHRKLLSNRLKVYPINGKLISGLSSCCTGPPPGAVAPPPFLACAARSSVALSVWSISSVGK